MCLLAHVVYSRQPRLSHVSVVNNSKISSNGLSFLFNLKICYKIGSLLQDSGVNFDAVSVGAILSDYQRIRVENV